MDAYKAIISRRSIRKYTAEPVPDEVVEELLVAAMSAPSANNQQPWQFVVVTEHEQLDALAAAISTGALLKRAPLAIAVCGDMQLQKAKGYWVQDCSIASQNILPAARAKGLGAVWGGGGHPNQERIAAVGKILDLPEHVIPLNVISIGYPARKRGPANRYDAARVHYDKW